MRAVRRAASRVVSRAVLLCVPGLCTLVSCGIPSTGVVEAGGPAHGIVPTVRVYLVADGALVAVPRKVAGQVDVESAVEALLSGPTDVERAKSLTTLLPQMYSWSGFLNAAPATEQPGVPTTDPSVAPATEGAESASVRVTTREDKVAIQLTSVTDELTELAAAQLICTAVDARRTVGPEIKTVTVTVTTAAGHSVEGSGAGCPGL
ncbi:hypothetical protein [Streptomyces sp. 3214.6]|uniref:hypothetical protein n=1 Tax=Streptomyces sp. 3214.6 TaxID=1882757 RepID=UPI000909B78D|nr:hypothetical protein [Streptomyces sp. 3214.6]SHH82255.1 hypothetical protein SAMN05444521_2088 [Streptomyces sp. 3214.6]